MWVSLIMALISFLTAKKSGKSTTQAAAIAAATGLGTYYVTTQTEWGRSTLGALNDSIADVTGVGHINSKGGRSTATDIEPVKNAAGAQVYDDAGRPLYQSKANPVVLDANGRPVTQSDGSIAGALITGAAGVLTSWGPTGTAAVIGTTAAVTSKGGISGFIEDNAKWLLLGLGVFLILRKEK